MLIDIYNLSNGMGKIFMREFMETAKHMSCDKGHILFKKGAPTHHFYTLIQGEFLLTIGCDKQHVYRVCHPGDLFGWSSLVGRSTYSATAVSTGLSDVFRFDSDVLANLLEKYPENGFLFFRKLAEVLGKRLLESYLLIQGDKTLDCSVPKDNNLLSLQ